MTNAARPPFLYSARHDRRPSMLAGRRCANLQRAIAALSLIVAAASAGAQETHDLGSLSVDDLMNVEVTSVARKGQKLSDTAAAVFVITRDDIRRPSVVAGCIYTNRGLPFATYSRGSTSPKSAPGKDDGTYESPNGIELLRGITVDGERVGSLYIASDQRDFYARLKEDVWFMAVILLVCLGAAFILSSRLQGRISAPIAELARVAATVSQHRDYTVRATSRALHSSNEVTDLVAGFNGMLGEIERRDQKLLLHQTLLEATVALRTGELTEANGELVVAKLAADRVAEINADLARESALILNSARDGIVGVGLDNRASFLNPAALRMLGRSPGDFHETSLHELVHHTRADGTVWPEADCPLAQSLGRGEAFGVANDLFWRRDGSSFPVEYSATPMLSDDGTMRGAVVMFRDVTERRAVERLKSEFVSTVSHELRTPLTSIRGALGLLASGLIGPVAGKAQRMLDIAVANTDRLVRLINDILDLERIDSGKAEVLRKTVDAGTLMVQASEAIQSIADQAGVRLVVLPKSAALWGDSDRIIQTLTNLLGNAIKFSPRETTVTLDGSADEKFFTFCIADEGRGIPEEKMLTIFERFSQVDASDSRDKGGSGLGLAICQSIVEAHGGRIWAERNEPAGSRFQFTVPIAKQPAGAPSILPPPGPRVSALVNASGVFTGASDGMSERVSFRDDPLHGTTL